MMIASTGVWQRVLVVDDDRATIDRVFGWLARAGYFFCKVSVRLFRSMLGK